MFSGAGNRHAVKNFKEIKIQCAEQCISCPVFRFKLTPGIKRFLSQAEYVFNRLLGIELVADRRGVALVCQRQLIL